MHTETKHTKIPARVMAAVALRDSVNGPATCIICGAPGGPWCHVVRRSQGGRGDTERNIVTLCYECHYAFDEGLFMERLKPLGFECQQDVVDSVEEYIKGSYPDWTRESVTYHKWGDFSR
ncbi:MAG: recombination protein [Caudoviricetes sp.]|nr:MAG: recombination protein [Caudoviricetes sp.]